MSKKYNPYTVFKDSLKKVDWIKENLDNQTIMPEKLAYLDSLFDVKNPDNIRDMKENASIFIALNYMKEERLLSDLLEAADKHGVDWCQKTVALAENETIVRANKLLSAEMDALGYQFMPISGVYLDIDLEEIKKFYEYSIDQRWSDDYRRHQHIRDEYREVLFNMIADGKTLYSYEELKEFHDYPQDKQKSKINCSWQDWVDETNVFETNAYKRAMRRIEYEIFKHENKELFNKKDFTKLPAEQKDLILEFTDSKDVAKAIIDTYKGNMGYNDLIARHFTREEFEQAAEDYKITQYRRDNERLKAENAQMKEDVAKEWEKIRT